MKKLKREKRKEQGTSKRRSSEEKTVTNTILILGQERGYARKKRLESI